LAANFQLTDPEHKLVYRKVQITGKCVGTDADPLVAAIKIQQLAMHHTVDGKVSVVSGNGKVGAVAFFLFATPSPIRDYVPEHLATVGSHPELPRQHQDGGARRDTQHGGARPLKQPQDWRA
jgi:hypothetical protein